MAPHRTFLLSAALLLGVSGFAQEERALQVGKVLIPDTSLEQPGDQGHRAHTNHRVVLEPDGGLGPKGGMTPTQLRRFYGFSGIDNSTGGGIIAIVDAYHYPSALGDFNVFAGMFGLPTEPSTNPLASTNTVFQVVYTGNKKPSTNAGWAQEAALDVQWAHAMAPAAKIVLVEAQSNSFADLMAAVDLAKSLPGVRQVSMSWGGSEFSGQGFYDYHFGGPGPIFFASSGDAGGKVIYPSSSAYVVSVGGTSVKTDSFGTWTGEGAWTSGGGGPSAYTARPAWQSGISTLTPRRGTPDISSDADPATGVAVYDSTPYKGRSGWMVFGGTSVSAPCMAGMANASGVSGATHASTTDFLTALYGRLVATPSPYRDITTGNNGYPAALGWDFTTGVGTPQGAASF